MDTDVARDVQGEEGRKETSDRYPVRQFTGIAIAQGLAPPAPMGFDVSQLIDEQAVAKGHALPASIRSERVVSIDGLRIVAALGIVWFHTEGAPFRQIAYAGLPVFLLIFFSLISNGRRNPSMLAFMKRRGRRLLKPWLFWSLLYGLFRVGHGIHTGDLMSCRAVLSWEVLLTGTHVHLWYLPYAFASGLVVYALHRWTARLNNTAVVLIATGAGVLVLVMHATTLSSHRLACPVRQWEFGLAAIPLGFAIGRSLMAPSYRRQRFYLFVVSFMTQVTAVILLAYGHSASVVPYSLATALVCLAHCWRSNNIGIVAVVAPLTFGIYLIHPLINLGLRHVYAAEPHCVAFVGLTVCVSALITLALMRTRLRAFV